MEWREFFSQLLRLGSELLADLADYVQFGDPAETLPRLLLIFILWVLYILKNSVGGVLSTFFNILADIPGAILIISAFYAAFGSVLGWIVLIVLGITEWSRLRTAEGATGAGMFARGWRDAAVVSKEGALLALALMVTFAWESIQLPAFQFSFFFPGS